MLIIKIFISVCFVFTLGFSVSGIDADDISAKSAVVINRETKEIVFEKNAYEKRSMDLCADDDTGTLFFLRRNGRG